MTILAGDIKLIASQVMEDVPEGGGAPTATVIADAVSNAIFDDISELARAGGQVSMRKMFLGVKTPTRDGYFGANVIVADPPDDPNVSVSIFSNGSVFDRRADASNRVESYLNAGPEWAGFLYENHISGQRSIQLFMRPNQALPVIGHTVLLRQNEGLGTEYEQYVRITRVASEERTFTIPASTTDYQAVIVTCDLSDALRFDFPGTSANREFTRGTGKTIVRDTRAVDAANYFSAQPLSTSAAIGDSEVVVSSIYTQLVPNARTETSVLDQKTSADYSVVLDTTPREVLVGGAPLAQRIRIGQENRGFNYVTILTPLPKAGSLRVTFRALGVNYSIYDNGDGTMGGTGQAGTGTVNYTTGSVSITLNALPDDRSAVVFYWGQAVSYSDRSGLAGFRRPEYAFALDHNGVVPGSVTFTWLSGGITKTATANAAGVISGDAVGDLSYASGLVFLRPSAMLDAGGEISVDYQWSTVQEESFPGLTPDGAGAVTVTLAQQPLPGTVEVSWLTTREVTVSSGSSIDSGSTAKSTDSFTSQKTYNIFGWPQMAATATVVTNKSSSSSSTYTRSSQQTSRTAATVGHLLTDDGAGGFIGSLGTVVYATKSLTAKVVGDYSETSFQSNYESAQAWENLNGTDAANPSVGPTTTTGGGGSGTSKGGNYGSTSSKDIYGSSTLRVRYKYGTVTPTSATQTYTPAEVAIDLCPYTKDAIVPGSVQFTWMGTVYQDFEGKIYRGRTTTVAGIHSGNIDYSSGIVKMFDYVVSGSPTSFTLDSLWTTKTTAGTANVTFATSLAPLKAGALTLSVLDASGTQLISTADLSGDLTGPHTRGKVDFESGLVEVQFGDYVLDSSLTAAQKTEWWYHVGDVIATGALAGKIWKPWPVQPDTLRYNFVSYFYLPLDADILGLDPVRLPQDGRVPIYRAGGFVVLTHKGSTAPGVASNGGTVDCGRVRLSRVRVVGNNGVIIDTGYTVNLDTGIVTWTDVTGYSQPVHVEHWVEDMAMIAEVQINGRLRLTRQLTHVYPAPGSFAASALVAGDLRARVSALFDQVSWSNVWSDAQIGSSATATFDDISHPIQVTNAGALTERWAAIFTNTTAFYVVGEHVGVIATGNTSTDCSPLNPASGTPYFTIPAVGWNTGWSQGNVMRFNTVGAYYPFWAVRTVQQGPETVPNDSFTLLLRGDVDA